MSSFLKKRSKVTKSDVIDQIFLNVKSSYFKIEKKYIKLVVDAFFEELKNNLCLNNVIELRSFGTFEIKKRKGRPNARNPQTGEFIKVEDHSVVCFKPGKDIKGRIWNLKI